MMTAEGIWLWQNVFIFHVCLCSLCFSFFTIHLCTMAHCNSHNKVTGLLQYGADNQVYHSFKINTNKNLKFTSWNVRGMVKIIKLKQVITRFKQLDSSIAFIQETHLLG